MQSAMKRFLSLVLVVVMTFSVVPAQVLADEIDNYNGGIFTDPLSGEPEVPVDPLNGEATQGEIWFEEPQTEVIWTEEEAVQQGPSALAIDLVNRINAVLNLYGITADMTDDQIGTAICAQPWSVNKPTISEIAQIEEMAEMAPESDAAYVLANADVVTFVRFKDIFKPMFAIAMAAASGNHKPVEGVSVGVSGATDNSMSSGAITVTAKGSGGIWGIGASAKTATITVANDSGSKAKLSFNWTATSVNQLKIDGVQYTGGSGSFEKVMDSGTSFTITITTAKNSTVNKLVMNNFAIVAVKESSNVTFLYDSALGSVTVAGNAAESGSSADVPMSGVELKATAKNGAAFVGWIDADTHIILSKSAAFKLEPANDMTVQAVFAKNAWFIVNGNCLYEGLDAALAAVAEVDNKTIVLANNGTLLAGNYTIPSGITLLIPYDAANTLCTTVPSTTDAQFALPTVYRKMTMAEGANIVINGALSLSALQSASGGNSSPIKACSFIQMETGSTITVNGGGKLYAWGYIQGSGAVTVENGGAVYECFQVKDWRGGDNTSGMIDNSYRVFPMSQYYIQNIEVPMTLKAGATEKGYMSVQITMVGIQGSQVPFIGSDGMFNITSGNIVKDYDEETGRLLIDVNGNLTVKSLSLSMKLGLLGTATINSSKYTLPLNGNMTINMHSGSVTMTQDIALLPGARLIVGKDATCSLGSGNKIYVYDYDEWTTEVAADAVGEGPSFCGTPDATHINLTYPESAKNVEGRTDDAYVEVNGVADLSKGYVYTTASGASIRGTGTIKMKPGTDTATHQVKNTGSDNKTDKWVTIPITSAKLQNADGTYVETANNAGLVIYQSVNGNWVCEHTFADGTFKEQVTNPTCTESGTKTITCNCGYVKTEAIDALGHAAGAEATCETAQTCTVCGAELNAALGHDEVSHEGQKPTCEAIGWDAYVTCARCDYTTYVEQAAKGHNYQALVIPPTCTEAGYTIHTCNNDASHTYTDSDVAALGHSWKWVTDEEATVLKPGVKHEECSVCGEKQNENTEIPILVCPHGDAMIAIEAKDATCAVAGNSAYWYCTACRNYYSDAAGQHEIEKNSWIIPAKNHAGTMEATEATDATCTEDGNSAYWYCSACQNYYSDEAAQNEIEKDSWVIPALGHTAGAAATCTTAQICTVCETELEPAKGHGSVDVRPAVAATCQVTGAVARYHCYVCGQNYKDAELTEKLDNVIIPIDPENHNWSEEPDEALGQKATCVAEGTLVYHCLNENRTEGTVCAETKTEVLPIDPEAHAWDEGVPYKNHNCNSASYDLYTCTLCQAKEERLVREQHFRVPIAEEIPATCTEPGMTSGMKCEQCDEFWIAQEEIPALGHDWNGQYPCQNETSACTRCDLAYNTKQEHQIVVDEAVRATCLATGLTEGSHCALCGEVLVAQEEVPVADHEWFVADLEVPARCGAVGHKEGAKYCVICDYDEDPIPALDHEWMHRDAKLATYTAVGYNDHDYCLLCKVTRTKEQYEGKPCEFCGENPEGYVEIPKKEVQRNETLDNFLVNIGLLELIAYDYSMENPGADPLALVLNYMRTAVENYTSGSWAIMAGAEDKEFLEYVRAKEDMANGNPEAQGMLNVSGLKKLSSYPNEHGEVNYRYSNKIVPVMSGHFFGTMDMTYHNKGSQNHADVGGWVGDLTDLLSTSDEFGVPSDLSLEEKVAYIRENYLFNDNRAGAAGAFGSSDLYADLDAYYIMNELKTKGYDPVERDLEMLLREYYKPGLTIEQRVSYLLTNRLDGLSTRKDLRDAVYNVYTSNKLIATLEGTRNFKVSGDELAELRKAVCYAFADEMCAIAGDYVEDLTNPRFTVFDSETQILAPGVSQQISYATNADGKQIVYYIATADVTRDDVGVWVNYYDRDPGTPENPIWKNNSVPSSAQNAQDRYGDPASEDYIENFSVIASTNAGGYDMSDTATPGGLMVMNGIEWYPQKGSAGFFAILDDGTAYMGTAAEYETMKDRIKEAIGGFGEFVVKDGEVVGNATYSDAPRTSVGITATGRVVLMCIDGRQAPFSSGASLQDMGYIMREAGCVVAINLDGGGSTTFVARQPGDDELTVMNRPSDGYPRNVSSNLLIYSTAPSSTAFDHAVIESQYDYATIGTSVQMTAAGVSPSGNAVDVPEGVTWAVSNDARASITEDGLFTGKELGEVSVYLMLDGQVVGSKQMVIGTPDQLYFEREKIDAIYGSSVTLPLRARVGGKQIAINPNDVTISLSVPKAGAMDGFVFCAAESDVKTLSITAAVGSNIKASINVMLYQQGENSFDFDNATGGDRRFAWDRQVSNAKVEDGNIYNVIDPSKDMVTSYIFALDMTTIPVPERLEELTYMLPGGTVAGTNAWSYLLNLAQRISDLSWVKATIDFDDRFDVDYSQLEILNEYFEMKAEEFDETTNTLTVTMHWIKQSQVINEATANPLCLIKGIKLTPKDGVWEDTSKIDAVISGTIGYEIYMRASGLYGFAQKPESQAVFGLYPYRNPADTSDAGGYFKDTYAEISDEYTLVNILKEGWVNEDGGFAYYVDGERLTGVKNVDGFYYDFGEKGINVGQTKYTGLFYDEEAKVYRYSYLGVLTTGWQMINKEWYYFDSSTKAAATGKRTISHVPYEFEETGRLVSGVWMNVFVGYRYYYGPDYVRKGWYKIGGDMYYFKDAFAVTGDQKVASQEISTTKRWYRFAENGACEGLLTGIVENNGKLYYVENGKETEKGLFKFGDYHYNAQYDGSLIVNQKYYVWKLDETAELPKGHYEFDEYGRLLGAQVSEDGGVSGIIEKDGKLYYYENGKPTEKGLFKYNGEYYNAQYDGSLITNQKYYVWKLDETAELPKGHYEFGADGRMLQGIIDKDGKLYYYENGAPKEKGLFQYEDGYYVAQYDGSLIVNQKYYVWKLDETADLPKGHYEFGIDGKMYDGVVNKNGAPYYYELGVGVEKGLFLYEDGCHYFAQYGGELVTNQTFYAWKLDDSALLDKGHYEFDADGKLVGSSVSGEIVNKDGVLYYYENGKPTEKGLFKFNGDYYVAQYDGKIIIGKYYVWKHDITSNLPNDHYEFGADGKMLQGIVDKEGKLYYYENGKPTEKGLFKYNGDYYVAQYDGSVITGKYYVWKLDETADLPKDHYEFGADGKMLQGIIDKDGVLYYYENGRPTEKGLFVLNGDYYFSHYDGSLVVNQKYYAWKLHESSELEKGTYLFDESGKVVGAKKTGEIVEVNGILYYYECGKAVDKGVFVLDGYYYCTIYDGSLVVNQRYYVWKDNEYLMVKHYDFNEFGQIVG